MSNEITIEMLDRKIAWCEQNLFWGRSSLIQSMKDFMYEQQRESITEDWGDEISLAILSEKLNVPRVSYRIYYSKDTLTRRIFIFRGNCSPAETEIMLGLGFTFAKDGDTENIPDQPIEEVEQ
jgi:hypothetical protein